MDGYRALREGAAWLDLSRRGKIFARGEDRKRLLHAMTTNHVEQLEAGSGCYTFFLNAQGHILGDANLFCMRDSLLLDTEPETVEKLYAHLDRYIIADDVTLEDRTSQVATLGLEGPKAADLLLALGAQVPAEPYAHQQWQSATVAGVSSTGGPGFTLFVPAEEKAGLVRRLEAGGAAFADDRAARVVRLEHGKPRYGEDFNESNLPQETQLLHAVHFNKGCYLGQEIVERIRSRGRVNRLLVQLQIDSKEALVAGVPVLVEGNQTGHITSAVYSPGLERVVALAWVGSDDARPGAPLSVEGNQAEVASASV